MVARLYCLLSFFSKLVVKPFELCFYFAKSLIKHNRTTCYLEPGDLVAIAHADHGFFHIFPIRIWFKKNNPDFRSILVKTLDFRSMRRKENKIFGKFL